MTEQDKNRGVPEEQKPEAELSPSEKLDQDKTDSSLIPGAQNPDNEAIKSETNPNTE
jgi:hypothetical protein